VDDIRTIIETADAGEGLTKTSGASTSDGPSQLQVGAIGEVFADERERFGVAAAIAGRAIDSWSRLLAMAIWQSTRGRDIGYSGMILKATSSPAGLGMAK
jgi:hypothetical protein